MALHDALAARASPAPPFINGVALDQRGRATVNMQLLHTHPVPAIIRARSATSPALRHTVPAFGFPAVMSLIRRFLPDRFLPDCSSPDRLLPASFSFSFSFFLSFSTPHP
jgi:hypothetical protein